MPSNPTMATMKAADVSAVDLNILEEFVVNTLDDGPLADFLTHLIDSLREGRDMVLMSTASTTAIEGLTAPDDAFVHPSYRLVHRDLGDTWNVVACGRMSAPLTRRVPLPDETERRCPTCWPADVDPSTLRGVTKTEILARHFRSK